MNRWTASCPVPWPGAAHGSVRLLAISDRCCHGFEALVKTLDGGPDLLLKVAELRFDALDGLFGVVCAGLELDNGWFDAIFELFRRGRHARLGAGHVISKFGDGRLGQFLLIPDSLCELGRQVGPLCRQIGGGRIDILLEGLQVRHGRVDPVLRRPARCLKAGLQFPDRPVKFRMEVLDAPIKIPDDGLHASSHFVDSGLDLGFCLGVPELDLFCDFFRGLPAALNWDWNCSMPRLSG